MTSWGRDYVHFIIWYNEVLKTLIRCTPSVIIQDNTTKIGLSWLATFVIKDYMKKKTVITLIIQIKMAGYSLTIEFRTFLNFWLYFIDQYNLNHNLYIIYDKFKYSGPWIMWPVLDNLTCCLFFIASCTILNMRYSKWYVPCAIFTDTFQLEDNGRFVTNFCTAWHISW